MAIPQQLVDQAMAGSAQAQLEVGRHYAAGKLVPYDLEAAFRWFELATKRELPEAMLEVALAREYGLGVDRDYDLAFSAYMRAARLFPGPLPFFIRGMTLTQNLCLDQHRGQLALAEAGYAHSQWAFVYGPKRQGHQWRELKDAEKWIRRSAGLGYPPAFGSMAAMVSGGRGKPEDGQPLEWYLKDYEHEKPTARSIVTLYEPTEPGSRFPGPTVRGVVPDQAKADEWMQVWHGHVRQRRMMGAAGGADYDAKALAELYLYGRDGVSRDYAEAMRWLLRAGEMGCAWSLGQVAKMYFQGLGVPKDLALGLRCLDRMYARAHHNGTGILDQELVFHWAMHSVIVGYLDDLGDDALFEWLQARTRAFSAECGALRSDYHREDGSVDEPATIAMHVCKAFNPHARVKGELAEAARKTVDFRVGRIARLLERQKGRQEELAKSGDIVAQFYYSRTLPRYKGRAGHAQKWLLQSAEQGFPPAQYEAGKAFATGEGAPVSAAEAHKWYLAAAKQGHTWAQDDLIRILAGTSLLGDGVKVPKRIPADSEIFEGYAWSIVTGKRATESALWLKYSPEQVLAAYRRADEIRREIAGNIAKEPSV